MGRERLLKSDAGIGAGGDDMRARAAWVVLVCCVAAAWADWPCFRGTPLQEGIAPALPEKLEVLWKTATKDSFEGTAAIYQDTVYLGGMDEHLYAFHLADGKEKWKVKISSPLKASPAVAEIKFTDDKGTTQSKVCVFVGDQDGGFRCLDGSDGKPIWEFKTNAEIISSPNVVNGKVLFGSYDEHLYCLDAASGKLLWKFKTEGPINSAPAVAEGRAFVAGCDAVLRIVDINEGKEVATVELGSQAGASAAVSGNMLYVGNMDRSVLGIDWKAAKVVWEYQHPRKNQAFYSSPAVAEGFVVVGGRDRLVHGIDARTGEYRWEFQTRGKVDSSPVISGGKVYVGSSDGNLYVLDLKTGRKLAEFPLGSPILASPAVSAGKLVIGTQDGLVFCLGARQ